ncbi:SPL family radical SAM protein [Desmospora activa]|nr:radical SAM protein [Desmospora activa]
MIKTYVRWMVILLNGELPARWFPKKPKSILNRVEGMPFQWSINPYRGCGHGCHFCYARGTHSWLGYGADDSFRNNIVVKRDAADVLEAELKRGKWTGGGISLGTATDPYQQLEGKLGVTRSILEVLRKYKVPCSITTRSPLILRDLDLLREMEIHSINISISTLDEGVWKCTEPSSPHPQQRLRTVARLVEAGLCAGLFLAPIIPYLTDEEQTVENVIQEAQAVEARFLSPSLLRLKPEVKSWFFRQLQSHYPLEVARLARLYEGAHAPESFRKPLLHRIRCQIEAAGFSTEIPIVNDGDRVGSAMAKKDEGDSIQLSLF